MDNSTSTSTSSKANTASTSSFLTALWLNGAVFGVEMILFTLFVNRFKAIYQPRTFIPFDEKKRSPPLPKMLLAWPLGLWRADYNEIKSQNGMDAYFFVRYLRMMIRVFLPIWVISWIILLPVTAVGSTAGLHGLDKFTFGNVAKTKEQKARYAAQLILVYFFTFWVLYNIKQEMRHFVTARQRYLISTEHNQTAQANTVLITGIPSRYLSERALKHIFSHLPGGVAKVWLNRDLKDLPDLFKRRMKACDKLESAETALLSTATKLRAKQDSNLNKDKLGEKRQSSSDDVESGSDATKIIPVDKRPTHRLPIAGLPFALPLLGKKVDTIEWATLEIAETNEALSKARAVMKKEEAEELAAPTKLGGVAGLLGPIKVARPAILRGHASSDPRMLEEPPEARVRQSTDMDSEESQPSTAQYPPLNSAFILFHSQTAAHMAAQVLTHHEPYRMSKRYVEVAPGDIIWENMGLNPYELRLRAAMGYALTGGLILLWAIPVAFVGAVSNIATLCTTYKWLAWLCKLPNSVLGLLQGVLPPVLLAVLMMLLPIILRTLARMEGVPTRSGVELSVMTRYFLFVVLHSFLIVTLSSGLIASLSSLVKNPSSVPGLLAQNLPRASTFFLTYIILQGLTGTASGFLAVVSLIIYYVKLVLLGSTPRAVYNIKYVMGSVQWGTLFPATTLITVIALGYSVISPIVNGLAVGTFVLFYFLWKYLFLYQYQQPASTETGGLIFPKAIQHVFVGLYIEQICLMALFFLAQDSRKKPIAVPEGALMIVLIVITAFFHIIINSSYGPLLHSLPLSLSHRSHNPVVWEEDEEDRVIRVNKIGNDSKPPNTEVLDVEGDPELKKAQNTLGEGSTTRNDDPAVNTVEEPLDFYHPAAVEPQRTIWIPKDEFGFSKIVEKDLKKSGITVGDDGSVMDVKCNVDIVGPPPKDALVQSQSPS